MLLKLLKHWDFIESVYPIVVLENKKHIEILYGNLNEILTGYCIK